MRRLAGRYVLGGVIGTGGMSVVLRAHDLVLRRDVAVKVPTGQLARTRMQTEARCGARVDHPNVARVYDFGSGRVPGRGRVPYLITELLHGVTLADRLAAGALDWPEATGVCRSICAALVAAHRVDVVHRDVNPANVMLTATGARLLDFGFAAVIGDAHADPPGLVLGTREYLAPERWHREPATPATDVYGVGLMLYQCLVGRLPWNDRSGPDLMSARRYIRPEPLPAIDGLPPAIEPILLRCLRPEPLDRPSLGTVARALASTGGQADLALTPVAARA
jgi:eukaryotic-like serine/threonine-protein kinase